MVTEEGYDIDFLDDISIGGSVATDTETLEAYSYDEGPHPAHCPNAVVHVESATDVSIILDICHEHGVAVTPRSGGSSIEGNPIPVDGGIVLDTLPMNDVKVRPADRLAIVGPGVVYDDLNSKLEPYGLRFAPGIAAGDLATVGGMVANNASGLNAVKYGVTGDHVCRLTVVLANGEVIQCGRDVAKSSSGYQLKDLFVGSEGTLGVVTEIALALEPLPAERRAALATFPTRTTAGEAVANIMASPLTPGAIEYLDSGAAGLLNETDDADLPESPQLLVELHGTNKGVDTDIDVVRMVCQDADCGTFETANEAEMDRLWAARRNVYPAACEYRTDATVAFIGDVVVPVSKYPAIVSKAAELSKELELAAPCVGHAGDGNLHFLPIADLDDEAEFERATELNDRMVRAAISMGGTSTGEHGVGIGKRKFMREEHAGAVDLMRDLKATIDPDGILNPEKILPEY
jgi:D-lactate dehydrogenase (cytochrome)